MRKRFILFFLVFSFFTAYSLQLVAPVFAQVSEEKEAELRKELEKFEKELEELNKQLSGLKQQSATYERDLNLLTTQIRQAQTNIKAKTLAIQNIGKQIVEKTKVVESLDDRIEDGRESLAQLLRKANELDSYGIIDVMFSDEEYSIFYEDLESYLSIQKSMEELFNEIRGNKTKTLAEKESLRKKQNAELDAKAAIEASERAIATKQVEAKQLLNASKNQEIGYKTIIADKERKAAAIRTALFGLRDSEGIQFGDAYEFAKLAQQKTGIRPAFLLAILTQESNLGKNVGSCYLRDTETADGIGVTSGEPKLRVMHPTRDIPPFLAITESLGLDWKSTRVSCWYPAYSAGKPIGWGGAMGPAQFIPSTWNIFKDRIALSVGKASANPWEPKDAFMASAIYLTDLGAGTQIYSSERDAACRYYSGRRCDAAVPANTFYGNQVMEKAANIQATMIDVLEDN